MDSCGTEPCQKRNGEAERCEREIENITAQLLAGDTDMHGLLLALKDWGAELRLIEDSEYDDDPDEGYGFHTIEEYEEWEREWGPDEING